jgi:NarL family two-component system sensor histidine kinase LiaS
VILNNNLMLGIEATYGTFAFLIVLGGLFGLVVLAVSKLPVPEHFQFKQIALVIKSPQPDLRVIFLGLPGVILASAIFITILTGIIGTVFGYIFARGMTRRLKRLSIVVNRWGRGDFAARAVDKSQDEVASITDQLNHMAEQLQSLIQTRQELATLEERNRLARDLHDSIKQQVFAVSMQIGSIKLLLRRDVDAAEARLNKMETLVREAQQELTSLIRELRPVALDGKGLVEALRELIPQWSQQSDIVANLHVEGAQTLPRVVEEALLRVVQEALSNVARHSNATLVQITLVLTDEQITLTILDNGYGFDSERLENRGVGLFSMQERMKALGGDVKLESVPGKGTCITAFCNRLGVGVLQKL